MNWFGILIICVAIVAIVIFHEWFFGGPAIDDSQGFPYSRNRKRK